MAEHSPESPRALLPYKADILAHKDVLTMLGNKSMQQVMNVLANMVVAVSLGVDRQQYLKVLAEGMETGDFAPLRALYVERNMPELQRVEQESSDAITAEMRTAAKNTLGCMDGVRRGIEAKGSTSINDIGVPPEFQIPDWLVAANQWLDYNPETSVSDLIAELENLEDPEPIRRMGATG